MNAKEALIVLETVLKPWYLTNVQEIIFRQSWEGQTYPEIAESIDYDADYIKDLGSQLWKLLSKTFGEKVSKSNFRSILRRVAQQAQVAGVIKSDGLWNRLKTEFPIARLEQKAVNHLDQYQELTGEGHPMSESFNSFENTQVTKCSLEERLNARPQLKARIEALLTMVENAGNDVHKTNEAEQQMIKELRQRSGTSSLHRGLMSEE